MLLLSWLNMQCLGRAQLAPSKWMLTTRYPQTTAATCATVKDRDRPAQQKLTQARFGAALAGGTLENLRARRSHPACQPNQGQSVHLRT